MLHLKQKLIMIHLWHKRFCLCSYGSLKLMYDLGIVRVYGCIYYMHVPKNKLSKLDKKAAVGIVICYSLVSKVYTIYVLKARKLVGIGA